MNDEDAFLRAVAADPADRATRLVFTDWLLERGDDRAEFVRLDSQLRVMTGDEPVFAEMEARWRDWRAHLPCLWLGAFGHLFTQGELNASHITPWIRPVVRELKLTSEAFLDPRPGGSFWVVWGRADDFASGLDFWRATLDPHAWGPKEVPLGELFCAPVTEVSWEKAVRGYSQLLREPFALPLHKGPGAFIAALRIDGAPHSQGLLAAYRDEYIGVLWFTTAWPPVDPPARLP